MFALAQSVTIDQSTYHIALYPALQPPHSCLTPRSLHLVALPASDGHAHR
jgi:hypothetical protein